ncbi:hypothetical protein NEDG_01260 [Nematocida displodere]|uniref:Protein RER1 n=1 Tax=Nematocida displodere TaxID=1805483 RepID=A0A177EB69_9MICR|nr:hypothetical protein NEDG_01260 [Nematocida displodere]
MQIQNIIHTYANKAITRPRERWLGFAALVGLFALRVYMTGGYRLVSYCFFLYLLHGFIGFCTPIDSEVPDPFEIDEDPHTPVDASIRRSGDETKPFIRRLPEVDYWYLSMQSVLTALTTTFIPLFNIPVYTPILVVYFLGLVYLTGIKIKKHMERYKYNPFYNAKKIYRTMVEK